MNTKHLASAVGATLLLVGSANAAVITYLVDSTAISTSTNSDFYVASNATGTLVGNTTLLAGRAGTGSTPEMRSFLKFDITGLNSEDAVTSAVFRIYRSDSDSNNYQYGSVFLFSLDSAFDTGAANKYSQLGGTSRGTILAPADTSNKYFEVDVTALVQAWQADPSSNFGFAIRGEEGFNGTGKIFHSATGANVPQLVVTTVPEPSAIALLGLGGLALVIRRRR